MFSECWQESLCMFSVETVLSTFNKKFESVYMENRPYTKTRHGLEETHGRVDKLDEDEQNVSWHTGSLVQLPQSWGWIMGRKGWGIPKSSQGSTAFLTVGNYQGVWKGPTVVSGFEFVENPSVYTSSWLISSWSHACFAHSRKEGKKKRERKKWKQK